MTPECSDGALSRRGCVLSLSISDDVCLLAHVGCLEFPHETGLILKCAAKFIMCSLSEPQLSPSLVLLTV